mgnify:CR=1 FL=1
MAGVKGRSGGSRPNTGGARKGAGRKPAEPVLIDSAALLTSDPKRFLTALMNDVEADIKVRADAAKALLSASIRTAEAKFPQSASPSAEKATALIKSEGIKLEESVFATCKRDFMGKPKASGEFSCLSRANTYADVQACATMPAQ